MQSQRNLNRLPHQAAGLMLLGLLTTLPVLSHASSSRAILTTDTDTVQDSHGLDSINSAQKRSFYLLMHQYKNCYQLVADYTGNGVLNSAFDVSVHEKHTTECGGDPITFPRVATYAIDQYGRIFKHNIFTLHHDLQYKFDETPVIVTDLTLFNHPTRTVFNKYGIRLQKLEKRADNTFVTFYVADTPLLNHYADDVDNKADIFKNRRQRLFNELLKANGDWDFMIRTAYGDEFYVEGSKRKVIDEGSYLKITR